jgi:nucleoid-associated protein YgaU
MSAPDPTSRYAGLPEITVVAADGSTRRLGAPRAVPVPPSSSAYTVRAGDRLDLLGLAATGDSTRWWVLADANPWIDPTRLERPGLRIRLPDA